MSLFFTTVTASVVVGGVISLFMFLLGQTVYLFQNQWTLLAAFLPMAGWVLFQIQRIPVLRQLGDSESILEEIRNPQKLVSPWLSPFILIATLWSHLFGATVGRESTAIQIGASSAESVGILFAKWFRFPQDRAFLLRLGLACGFSAAFGTPWAGFVFGFEHPQHFTHHMLRRTHWLLLGSLISYEVSQLLGLSHSQWPSLTGAVPFSAKDLFVLSLVLAVACVAYEILFHFMKRNLRKLPGAWPLMIGGVLLAALTFIVGSPRFNGLGTELTAQAFQRSLPLSDFLMKALSLLLSTAAGYKGGEVTPLISLSTTLTSSLFATPALVAISVPCFFSYRLRCPVAGLVLLVEFFGFPIAIYGVVPLFATWMVHEIFRWLEPKLRKSSTLKRYF